MAKQPSTAEEHAEKNSEVKALAFIVVVLFPALTVAVVGTYGLAIWLYQTFGGVVAH